MIVVIALGYIYLLRLYQCLFRWLYTVIYDVLKESNKHIGHHIKTHRVTVLPRLAFVINIELYVAERLHHRNRP